MEEHFNVAWVTGELSNFARPRSGHWYFTLKDNDAQVRCAMFVRQNSRVQMQPADGQQVLIRGRVSLYEGRGDFQIIVDQMEPAGEGALRQAFERLKIELAAEGLFAEAAKRELPRYPKHIAVITSITGAALQDVLAVWRRRFAALTVTVLPTAVQGAEAEPQLLNALLQAESIAPDVLLITRGGGSLEDLWTFNTEAVARAVASSTIPTVSAIGHEIDITITDFVADLRAPTPSAAAELMVPAAQTLSSELAARQRQLAQALGARLRADELTLRNLQLQLVHPSTRIQQTWQRSDELSMRLQRAAQTMLSINRQKTIGLQKRLLGLRPEARLTAAKLDLLRLGNRLQQGLQRNLTSHAAALSNAARMLESVSPLPTLTRGYAIVRNNTDANGLAGATAQVISSVTQVSSGDSVRITVADGNLSATVSAVEPLPPGATPLATIETNAASAADAEP